MSDDQNQTVNQSNNDEDDLIMNSNTGNNDLESRIMAEQLSNQLFGGAQQGTGVIGANNEGFIDDIGGDIHNEDNSFLSQQTDNAPDVNK
jgi:hypothetical protein